MKKGGLTREKGEFVSDTASRYEKNKSEVREILLGNSQKPLSEEAMKLFLPKKVEEVVEDVKNISIHQLRNEKGEIAIIVLEKDSHRELTDKNAYEEWRKACADVVRMAERGGIAFFPPAPPSVNRLHARFNAEIEAGRISLTDRIIFTCKIKIQPDNKDALHVGDFDGETGQGIAQDFYTNTLPSVCKDLGLRYITGDNNGANIRFFKERLGRVSLDELRPEFRATLFPTRIGQEFFTIQFLYDEDRKKYVEKI